MSDIWRGHRIEWSDGQWVYCDTGEPTAVWRDRPCGHCGQHNTPDGHDACLGALPGVVNACCGHGVAGEAYIQYSCGRCIRGNEAAQKIKEGRKMPNPNEICSRCNGTGIYSTPHIIHPDGSASLYSVRVCEKCGGLKKIVESSEPAAEPVAPEAATKPEGAE